VNLLAKLIFFHGTDIANGKSGQSNLASDIETAGRLGAGVNANRKARLLVDVCHFRVEAVMLI
jgi:V8-like Glu-specific endopeptidase